MKLRRRLRSFPKDFMLPSGQRVRAWTDREKRMHRLGRNTCLEPIIRRIESLMGLSRPLWRRDVRKWRGEGRSNRARWLGVSRSA